jgi:N4-gp56 family major capsid protein
MIDAKMSFFGTYLAINEQVTLQNNDPVLNQAAIRLGVSLRETEDRLTSDMLASTAGFINCVGGFNGDVPTELTRSDVDTAVTTLMAANALSIMDQIEGADKFGTGPIRRSFFGLTNVDMCGSRGLDGVQGFIHQANYPNNRNVLDSEWGSIGSVRYLVSAIAPTILNGSSGAQTVYQNFIIGMESYGIVSQDGYTSTFVYRPAIYSGPLAQNITVGWKAALCPKLFNDQWLLNERCTLA